MEIPEEFLKEIAEQIILSRTKDIDYGLIVEQTIDLLAGSEYAVYVSNQDKIWEKVDELVSEANVSVEWIYDAPNS